MLNEDDLTKVIESNLSKERYLHTLRVLDTAVRLSENLDIDKCKLRIACIAHDMTKEDKSWNVDKMRQIGVLDEVVLSQPHVWHGFTSAYVLATEYGVENDSVLNAVRYHTIGSPNFDLIGKILYIADYIEPKRVQTRNFDIKNVEDLDDLLRIVVDEKISYFEEKKFSYHTNIIDLKYALE